MRASLDQVSGVRSEKSVNGSGCDARPAYPLKSDIRYLIPDIWHGAVAQLGERSNRTAEVTGSIPVGSTIPTPRASDGLAA
jgi:hypothetical protein